MKGVIWYQGESNEDHGDWYATLFRNLITNWRAKWGGTDASADSAKPFPFLFVQLANYGHLRPPTTFPCEGSWPQGSWPRVRESQVKALSLPRTAMVVTIDIGEGKTIHPRDKMDVGHRLALAAEATAYGKPIVYAGPLYDSMTVEGGKIRIRFKDTGGGLTPGASPWAPKGTPAPAMELAGFAIAGADKKWAWAKAEIDGNTVVVSSSEVAAPVAVRYGWKDNPSCNLYNKEGLPASPFRTDNW
jgi:sialate O-acetylesterase